MFWRVRGYGRKGLAFQAISGLDVALWDLKGKALNAPVYKLLGKAHDSVPGYGSGGWTNYTVDELIAEQTGYVEMGFSRVKMKVGMNFGNDERADIERLEAVRKAVGDDVEICVDANNGYYAKQAIRMARIFEEYDVGWFEEPVLRTTSTAWRRLHNRRRYRWQLVSMNIPSTASRNSSAEAAPTSCNPTLGESAVLPNG